MAYVEQKENPRSRKRRRNLKTMVRKKVLRGLPRRWCTTKEGRETLNRWRREYIKDVNKSEGFDLSGTSGYRGDVALMETICDRKGCSPLALLYAKMGLHRYNLLQGKNLQLNRVKKYNTSSGCAASTFYITLEAMDPDDSNLVTFQTKVSEYMFGELVLSCTIARPLGETTKISYIGDIKDLKPLEKTFFLHRVMPQWPSENPFEDPKRYHVMNESELRDNHEVIRLYLELAVATADRHLAKDLSKNLKVLQVAVDTTSKDFLDEALYPTLVATFYIRYKDSCEARVGKDVDRVAIVTRFFNQRFGCLSLVGQHMSSQVIITQKD